jgi:hypothetical protein
MKNWNQPNDPLNATESSAQQTLQRLIPSTINPARLAHLERKAPTQLQPLEQVTKPNLTTGECAEYLNRRPQTLRIWAMNGRIHGLYPKRIRGLLAWPTVEVKALAGVA